MQQLIPVINKLHDAFALVDGGNTFIDLPQIVVVGGQSSGKSSVLENIVGRDFLPRGSGIVTRRPLILQLINIPLEKEEKMNQQLEWGEFLHAHDKKFYDFNEIRLEIERETDRETGSNKGISPKPISLKIYSPYVLNLTLVDLPGVTKVPVGDQPKDIEIQLRKMVLSYIERPNTIILAVQAANVDLANSDALQLAQMVDSEGKRTLGVVTKLDLMDKGTDAMDVLEGRTFPLRLGYIGVVNRSQQDINSKTPISEAIKTEKSFFENHPIYRKIANRCGTRYLSATLNKLLINHIKNCLPELKAKVHSLLTEAQEELKSYGEGITGISPGALLLQIISQFSANYTEVIEGKLTNEHSIDELYGGARLNYIFNEIFARYLYHLHSLDGLTPNDIKTSISNATGPKAALFVPESAFELLVRKQIARMKEPSLQCVDLVFDELERIVRSIETNELKRFHNLRDALVEQAINLLRKLREPTREMISNIMSMEIEFINTNHPDFKLDEVIGSVMLKREQRHKDKQAIEQDLTKKTPKNVPTSNAPPLPSKTVTPNPTPSSTPPTKQSNPSTQTEEKNSGGFFNFFIRGNDRKEERRYVSDHSSKGYDISRSQPTLKLEQVPTTINVSASKEKELEIELLEGLLDSYFNIVRKNIQDAIPKAIMFFLVSRSKNEMQNELISSLYKEQSFNSLLSESQDVVLKRENCKSRIEILSKAQYIINEVRDYNLNSYTSSGLF